MSEHETAEHYRHSDALREILSWSEGRDLWQRDALRQLMQDTTIAEIDLDRLEALCTGEQTDAQPLTSNHLGVEPTIEKAVSLSKVSDIKGVNALVGDQELTFGASGITIIYGDNGSGKSGYCRVLKHACRSRDEKFLIHRDIKEPSDAPQSAVISYMSGEENLSTAWSPDSLDDINLGLVSIFDSRSANTHVQAENAVAYTPLPMRIMEGLGDLCDELKMRLETRAQAIKAQTPQVISNHSLSAKTAAGKFLGGLTAKSDISVLDMLAALSEDETRRLENLRSDLADDPDHVIRRLRAQQQRVEKIIASLTKMDDACSEISLNDLARLKAEWTVAQEASNSASQELFQASPLPDIGSDAWKVLWEAARAYSDEQVYKDKTFPYLSSETDLCVLCQQPLSAEAIERQKTFEAFVQGTTKTTEAVRKRRFDDKVQTMAGVKFTDESLSAADDFLKKELALEEVATVVSTWIEQIQNRLSAALETGLIIPVDAPSPSKALHDLKTEFQHRIEQLIAMKDPEGRAKLQHEKLELDERLKLAEIKDDIIAEVERMKALAALKKTIKSTARRPLTNKNKELSEKLVTGALRDRFAREIQKLRLNADPLELRKTRDSKGQSFFQVEFVKFPGEPLGDILSEGEHRCVALAAFMAELVTSKEYSGIVFDDPMSSLDHMYRVRVARRLAEEAQHRQVVIFTHDIGFLFEVKREAEARDVPLHYQHIRKRGERSGHIEPDLPLKAKLAPARVNALRSELKAFKGQFDTAPEITRVVWTKGIIEQLREVWDQVIADFIEPVLGRFDNKIKGSSMFKLLALTKADVEIMNAARGRLSEDLHNVAGALNPEDVTHDQLSKEVDCIHDFIQSLNSRPKPVQPRIRPLWN